MILADMLKTRSMWLGVEGPEGDVVLSSRIRLARNLKNHTFPPQAKDLELTKVVEAVLAATPKVSTFEGARIHHTKELAALDKKFLLERHLISHELASRNSPSCVLLGPGESLSLMVNEEDHIRLQLLRCGLDLYRIWKEANRIDDDLSAQLDFAFSQEWGYLTSCPTNTGTGLRASCLVHLPGLVLSDEINKVLGGLSRIGIAARGLYGEGTKVMGELFQISNAFTMGSSEAEIVDSVERLVRQVLAYEREARTNLLKGGKARLNEDRIFRAYGTLSQARAIHFEETLFLLSKIRMGVCMGLDLPVDRETLTELMVLTQPAHVQMIKGTDLSPAKRDEARAEMIRKALAKAAGRKTVTKD